MSSLTWSALESNPEVLTRFLRHLGVSNKWEFSDILSFDIQFLDFIPKPIVALLFLFPISDNKTVQLQDTSETKNPDEDVYFMHQCNFNACGTVALIHAIANNLHTLDLDKHSVIHKFIEETRHLTPEEKSQSLEVNTAINAAHEATAWEGETERPTWLNDSVCCHHYITLVQVNSKLYELDGKKVYPICHGNTTEASFLEDAAKICQEYVKQDPDNIRFNAMALIKNS